MEKQTNGSFQTRPDASWRASPCKAGRAMRNPWIGRAALAITVIGVSWANTGVERVAGDHEAQTSWQGFVKHRPSPRVMFENPAWRAGELAPFETLSPAERADFLEYCDIRWGASDVAQCQAALRARVL
jgi:hypothetical protein